MIAAIFGFLILTQQTVDVTHVPGARYGALLGHPKSACFAGFSGERKLEWRDSTGSLKKRGVAKGFPCGMDGTGAVYTASDEIFDVIAGPGDETPAEPNSANLVIRKVSDWWICLNSFSSCLIFHKVNKMVEVKYDEQRLIAFDDNNGAMYTLKDKTLLATSLTTGKVMKETQITQGGKPFEFLDCGIGAFLQDRIFILVESPDRDALPGVHFIRNPGKFEFGMFHQYLLMLDPANGRCEVLCGFQVARPLEPPGDLYWLSQVAPFDGDKVAVTVRGHVYIVKPKSAKGWAR